jgi:hypothetical protein
MLIEVVGQLKRVRSSMIEATESQLSPAIGSKTSPHPSIGRESHYYSRAIVP